METLRNVQREIPELFERNVSVKVVEVARKYNEPGGTPIARIPEYTVPGGPNSYHCSKIETSWTQGFFPGMLWLLVERARLIQNALDPAYTPAEVTALARRWQKDFEYLKRPAENHDQGFRFQLSYGKDLELTGSEAAKEVVIAAAESLVDRYDARVGAIRSWDKMVKTHSTKLYTRDNMEEHYLVIIDNMMNLDMMYLATDITGHPKYRDIANSQAEKSMVTHAREDGTTYHVINYDPKTGKVLEKMTHQGYANESCWARGQAWGIYGYAQCGRKDFRDTARKLADVFLSRLGPSGVPEWDFDAPKPCPYDASAGTIAARGLQMLFQLFQTSEPEAAEKYLDRGFKLIKDIVRGCLTPQAKLEGGKVEWGAGGWETILQHSTINGNEYATRRLMDHGLVYADYYFVEFGNEALKLQQALLAGGKGNGA